MDSVTTEPTRVWAPITRVPRRTPLLTDYERFRETFSWREAWNTLGATPEHLNIAEVAVDRWARGPAADAPALRVLSRTGPTVEVTYAELAELTDTLAVALQQAGLSPGDAVCTLLERSLPLYVTALGTLKAGAGRCPGPATAPR